MSMSAWNNFWIGICCRDKIWKSKFAFSPVTTTPPTEARGVGLAPVATLPDSQSRGIVSQLIREELWLCKEQGFDYCVVLGDPSYHQHFGFEQASPFGIRNKYGVDNEFMINRFSEGGVMGLVQYAPKFALFSV
jgi:putative acetyltransferase